jgi:hypothetical protein
VIGNVEREIGQPELAVVIRLEHRSFRCDARGEDAAVVSALKAVLACRLILRAVIPGLRRFVGGEFEDDDFLALRAFEEFGTSMKGQELRRMLLETGGNYFLVLVQLGSVASLFANEYGVGGHLVLSLIHSSRSNGRIRCYWLYGNCAKKNPPKRAWTGHP